MVFESVVVDVLNKVLGDYVVNLDTSQLKIGIWGGDVVLKDLALKETALNELNLPVKVIWGQLGKLVLKIPWKNLYGSPVLFDIEDLFVLVSPESDIQFDPEKEKKWELAAKQDELRRVEEAKKRAADKDLVKADDTFVEKLITQIIKNVQVRVERIHVRYEDRSTRQGAFSVGATMNKLSVETTDRDGTPCFAQDVAKIIYKALQLDGLSVYWNPTGETFSTMPDDERLRRFKSDIPTADTQPPGYLYVFGPISSSARLVLNLKPESDGSNFTTPKSELQIKMDNFSVALTRHQFQDMMLLVENMDRMSKGRSFRLFRPSWKAYRGHYRDWWIFAYNSVMVDIKRRRNDWNWLHIREHLQRSREYQKCYTKIHGKAKPPQDAVEQAKQLEETLDIFNLVLLRQRAAVEAERLAQAEEQAKANRGWFSGWLWSQPTAEEQFSTTIAKKIETAMTGEEKEKLYEAIGYQENAVPTQYPLTFVATRLSFVLVRAQVRVFDDNCLVLISEMNDFRAQLDQRPSACALRATVSVGEFSVNGLKQIEGVAQLVKSQCGDNQRLIDVIYETNPLDGRCDQRIHVTARPLNVIYNHETISRIQDIFSSADASGINQVKARTAASLPTFKSMSAMGLQFAVERRTRLDVKIDVSASTILIPHSGTYLPDRAMLILKLGQLSVETEEQKAASDVSIRKMILQGSTEQQAFDSIVSESYTTFNCQLTGMQVLMRTENEDWESSLVTSEATPLHLLQPTDLKVVVKKSLVTEDARIPKIKIEGVLPSICVHVMEKRVLALAALVFSMAKPASHTKQEPHSRSSSTWSLASISTHLEQKRKESTYRQPVIDNSQVVQGTNLDCKFIMNELVVQVSKITGQFLQISARQLQVNFIQKTLDAVLDVSLAEAAITQVHQQTDIPVLATAGATENEYLVALNVIMCERNSPELFTNKGGVLTLVKLKLRKSSLVLHQAALRALIDFGNGLSSQVEQVKRSAGVLEEPPSAAGFSVYQRKLSQIAEEEVVRKKRPGPVRRLGRNYREDLIDLKAVIEVERVSIELRAAVPIAHLSVDGVKLAVTSKRALTGYSIVLEGLQVQDLNPASAYSMAVISSARETIHADILMYDKDFMEQAGKFEVDMSVTATIGQLRLVYLQQFLTNILDFANSFQTAKEAVLEASAAAAERAKQNMMKAYEDAAKILLNINIKAPFIVVPRNNTSSDALIIDMGVLSIQNHFKDLKPCKDGTPLLDIIQLALQEFKLYRAAVKPVGLEVMREHPMLDPVTFKLDVNRNLSAAWYREIPDLEISSRLGKTQLALDHLDYVFLLSVLEENIGQSGGSGDRAVVSSVPADREASAAAPAVNTAIMFKFSMDSFVVSLHPGGHETLTGLSEIKPRKYGLARFVLQTLVISTELFSDGAISSTVRLVDCLLEDTREGKEGWLTTLMERKHDENNSESMIDIRFKRTSEQTTTVDVRVFSFTLILSVDYLLKLASFFAVQNGTEISQNKHKPVKSAQTKQASTLPSDQSGFVLNLIVEKPDIILVEKMESINTDALIFHTEIELKYIMAGGKQELQGLVADLELYSCCFNPKKRKKTMKQVVQPVSFNLSGLTPEHQGFNLNLAVSPIVIAVNPKTIQLLSRCSAALNASEESNSSETEESDWSSNWHPKRFNVADYWFLKPDEAIEAFEELCEEPSPELRKLSEHCVFEMPSVVVTVEAGVAGHTMPMLLLEMALSGKVNNWSSNLTLKSTLNLGMQYFNAAVGAWEPLIEPTESKHGIVHEYTPWQLMCEVEMNRTANDITSPPMLVKLTADDKLEMTVTRTCLDVLTQLGESFADAVAVTSQTDGVAQKSNGVSYLVKNDVGCQVILLLSNSPLQVGGDLKDIELENGNQVELRLPITENNTLSLPSSRSLYAFNLSIKVPELGDVCLKIPLDSAVKRLYPVPCPVGTPQLTGAWAVVAEVTAGLGSTTVTLRSVVQIHNHFSVSIDVHFMTNRGNELTHVGYVEPHATLNLPAYSVFTLTGELFFSVDGYSFSRKPFFWKKLEQEPSISLQLECGNNETENVDPFFLMAVGETERILMENTALHTLASRIYDIHLLPTVELINNLPTNVTLAAQGGIDEVRIVPGAKAHVPHGNPGVSFITLRIDNYLDKEWSCKTKLPEARPEVYVWDFESFDSTNPVVINLGVHCTVNRGSMCLALYCPFWMINKTGKHLSYKLDDSTPHMYHPATYHDPIMLSPSSRKFLGKKKGQVKVEQGNNWSDKFSLDVAGSNGLIKCQDTDGVTFALSVTIQLTHSSLTKMVIFTPAVVIVNKAAVPLEIQEQGSNRWMTAPAEECVPLWAKNQAALLVLRVEGTEEQTPPFDFRSTHSCLLMLHNKYGGVYIDVQCTTGGVYIKLHSYEPGLAPALVVNYTLKTVSLRENSSQKRVDLAPGYCVLHAWQQPTGTKELYYLSNQKEIKMSLTEDKVENYEPEHLWFVSFLDGLQRVILFTNDERIADGPATVASERPLSKLELQLHGFGLSIVNNRPPKAVELLYMGIVSSGVLWETRKNNLKRWKPMNVRDSELIENAYNKYCDDLAMDRVLDHIVVLDNRLQVNFETEEILAPARLNIKRSFEPGLWLLITQTKFSTLLHGKVNRLQLDNQTHGAIFPVILAPVPPPKTVAAENKPKPFMEVSIFKRVTPHSNVLQYKYFKVLIQEFHVKLDVGFVNLVSSFMAVENVPENINRQRFLADVHLSRQPLNAHIAVISSQEQKDFYDLLHFSPLKIHLSFSMAGKMENSALPEAISLLLQSVGITLTDIQDAVFRLSYLEKKNIFLTRSQLIGEATTHYSGQALRQVYVVLLGLDVIGNPFGLVTGIGEGVEALFYEPFQGMIQGPGEFAEGLGLGVKSLFGHTVGGAAGAFGRITGTLGKGLAALSLDKEYQQQRMEEQNRSANLQTSVAQGGRNALMGVVHGVTGVVTKPLEGARDEGVGGFFKGMGKGVMGLVTRPVTGVVDFASTSLNAVKRATDHGSEARRLRAPRLLVSETVVPYQSHAAEGNLILSEVDNKRYACSDVYQFHMVLITKDILVLTDKRIIIAAISDVFGTWQVHLVLLWSELAVPPVINPKGIVVTLEKKKNISMFSQGRENKLIPVPNTTEQGILLTKMVELYKQGCSIK